MACEGCTKKSKILLGLGSLFALVGVVLLVVSGTSRPEVAKVAFQVKNKEDPVIEVIDPEHCGYVLYIKDNEDCDVVHSHTTVTAPDGSDTLVTNDCADAQEWWSTKSGAFFLRGRPAIRKLGTFFLKDRQTGSYTVTSATPIWATEWCGQIGEAVSGFLVMLGLFVASVIILVISCGCCYVGCRCMGGRGESNVVVPRGQRPSAAKDGRRTFGQAMAARGGQMPV